MMAEDGIHQRRIRVQTLLSKGYNTNAIASAVGAHRNTVRSDLRSMNTGRFTVINDHDLDEILAIFFFTGRTHEKTTGPTHEKTTERLTLLVLL